MGTGEDDSGIGVANRELGRRQRKEAKVRERSKESRGERGEVGDEGAGKGKNREDGRREDRLVWGEALPKEESTD